ncbi:MAG: VOC family protein [Pseudomonadota bacterium]
MPHPIAYLSFDGNCAEAMRFYASALDGKLELMMTYGQAPAEMPMPPESRDRIMHARLVLADGGTIYAGDCMPGQTYEGIKGVSLTMNYDTIAQAHKVFDALADGGKVSMPMSPSFWSKSFGMLSDRFGTPWLINGELIAIEAPANVA